MRAAALVLALIAGASAAHAEPRLPWYRGFYTRVGVRELTGVQETFHAWAAFAFGVGYRLDRDSWGIDGSVLNIQYDSEEGLHTAARVLPYVSLRRLLHCDAWVGAGLSYGWIKGTVDEAIAKRRGRGLQGELSLGAELPRSLRVRMFVQGTLTAPLYNLHDLYDSRDSTIYVVAAEVALGVRF